MTSCQESQAVLQFSYGDKEIVTYPDGLADKLLESLKKYAELKAIFNQRFTEVPSHIMKHFHHEEMTRLKEYNPDVFLEKAYLLGFKKNKGLYREFSKEVITEFTQASDYVELLFCFDDTVHLTLSNELRVPEDTLDEIKNKSKYTRLKRKKKSFDKFYDYIQYLGE